MRARTAHAHIADGVVTGAIWCAAAYCASRQQSVVERQHLVRACHRVITTSHLPLRSTHRSEAESSKTLQFAAASEVASGAPAAVATAAPPSSADPQQRVIVAGTLNQLVAYLTSGE
jgi:hypothetical protein